MRVGASKIAGEHVLPCIISNFKRNNPSVDFNLEILDLSQIMEKISNGEIDIASYTKPCGVEMLEGEIGIARDELVVITPPGHNLTKREDITLEQILRYPLILYDTGCEVSNLLNEFFRLNGIRVESLKVKMLMPDVSSSIIAVLEGLGLSFCPELLAKKAKRAGVSGHNSCPRCRECNLLNLHIKM
ncbi:MAG: LysR substrate-binding domain-containing protein [Candidatus Bathyarchaeia archaeon]